MTLGAPDLLAAKSRGIPNSVTFTSKTFEDLAHRVVGKLPLYRFGGPTFEPAIRLVGLVFRIDQFPGATSPLPIATYTDRGRAAMQPCEECRRRPPVTGSSKCYECGSGR